MRKGRFDKSLSRVAQRYSESVSFDSRLYRHDIAGSIAHAAALAKAGIVSAAEQKEIEAGLREIEKEIDSGEFQWDEALEDVHMNIESALTKKTAKPARNCTPRGAGTIRSRWTFVFTSKSKSARPHRSSRNCKRRSSISPRNMSMLSCRDIRTCSAPNRFTLR